MQSFYGAGDWWHLPLRLLRCYVLMLPRLEAEAALSRVAVLQAADSQIDVHERRRLIAHWQRAARPEAERPVTKEQFLASMAGMGFAIEE